MYEAVMTVRELTNVEMMIKRTETTLEYRRLLAWLLAFVSTALEGWSQMKTNQWSETWKYVKPT